MSTRIRLAIMPGLALLAALAASAAAPADEPQGRVRVGPSGPAFQAPQAPGDPELLPDLPPILPAPPAPARGPAVQKVGELELRRAEILARQEELKRQVDAIRAARRAPGPGVDRFEFVIVNGQRVRSAHLAFQAQRHLIGEQMISPVAGGGGDEALGWDDEEPPVLRVPDDNQVVPNKFVLAASNFDRWMYGNMATPETRREWLDSTLTARLMQVERRHGLTPGQVEKLRLAARGDMKRLLDRIEAKRPGYLEARMDVQEGSKYLRDLAPLYTAFERGPYEDGSLFAKTLAGLVGGEAEGGD